MKWMIFVILSLFLTACGGRVPDQSTRVERNDVSFDEQSMVTGIRVHLDGPGSLHINDVDRVYLWTAEHMQITPPNGPLIVFKDRAMIVDDTGAHDGLYHPDTQTAEITSSLFFQQLGTPDIDGISRLLCHEMTHHILNITTGDPDRDHHSPNFNDCLSVFQISPGEHR